MRQFILRQNIKRFEAPLALDEKDELRALLRGMLHTAKRELAMLDASVSGVAIGPASLAAGRSEFQRQFEVSGEQSMLIDAGAGLHIVDFTDDYAAATMIARAKAAGQPLFDVFPDNPDDPMADGMSNLYESLAVAARTSREHVMADQRYDVRDAEGRWVERYWRPKNVPIFDDNGRVIFLLHTAYDVTAEVLEARRRRSGAG